MNPVRQFFRRVARVFDRKAIRQTIAPPMTPQATQAMEKPVDAPIGKSRTKQAARSSGPSFSTRVRKAIKKHKKTRKFRNQSLANGCPA